MTTSEEIVQEVAVPTVNPAKEAAMEIVKEAMEAEKPVEESAAEVTEAPEAEEDAEEESAEAEEEAEVTVIPLSQVPEMVGQATQLYAMGNFEAAVEKFAVAVETL